MIYELDQDTLHFKVKCNSSNKFGFSNWYYGIASNHYLFDDRLDFPYSLYHTEWNIFTSHMDNALVLKYAEWCEANIEDNWFVGYAWCGFFDESDAAAFKLRWL